MKTIFLTALWMTLGLVLSLSASLQAQVYCNNFNENAAGWAERIVNFSVEKTGANHVIDGAKLSWAYNRVVNYINTNVTANASTREWMPEGLGYMYYPMGNFVGSFGIAMARHNVTRDIRELPGTAMIYWGQIFSVFLLI